MMKRLVTNGLIRIYIAQVSVLVWQAERVKTLCLASYKREEADSVDLDQKPQNMESDSVCQNTINFLESIRVVKLTAPDMSTNK